MANKSVMRHGTTSTNYGSSANVKESTARSFEKSSGKKSSGKGMRKAY